MTDTAELESLVADLQTELDMLTGISVSGSLAAVAAGVAPVSRGSAMGGAGGPTQGGGGKRAASSRPGDRAPLPPPITLATAPPSLSAPTAAASRGPGARAPLPPPITLATAPPSLSAPTAAPSHSEPLPQLTGPSIPERDIHALTKLLTGYPTHESYLAATIPQEEFRNPQFVRTNVNRFRYLLVATHGLLIADSYKKVVPVTYTVPNNTILVKTGGRDACGKLVTAAIFKDYLHHYFKPAVREYTFCKFLGVDTDYSRNSIFPTLQFLTPGEKTYNKDLSLSVADTKHPVLREIIGVSEIIHDAAGNLVPTPKTMVNDIIKWKETHGSAGLTENELVKAVNAAYPVGGSTGFIANVLVLMSCSRGPLYAYEARTAVNEATRATVYSRSEDPSSHLGCPTVRPRELPDFPAQCRKESYISTPTSKNAKRNIEYVSRIINSTSGTSNQAELLKERFEEESSIAEVHKDMLITYLNRTKTLAQKAIVDPSIKCDIGGSLELIEGGRTEYENAMLRINEIAPQIKQYAQFYSVHPGMAKPDQIVPLTALAASIDLDQYARNLAAAKAAVAFGRTRAAARTKRGWGWVCELPGRAMASLASYLPKLPWQGGGTRRRRRKVPHIRRKTRRTK